MKKLIAIISLALFATTIFAQVNIESKIDSIQILIGQQTDLTLSVIAKRGSKVIMPQYERLDTIISGIEVVDVSKIDTIDQEDNVLRLSRKYTLTSFDENMYYIPGLKVIVDGKEYKGKDLALKVLTVDVDTLNPENFYPPKDVQDNPFSWNEIKPLFFLSILLVVLILLIYYLFMRLKQNKPIIARVRIIKRELPHQRAIREIESLKSQKTNLFEDQKQYYTLLTESLRKYIEERFGFNAMEMTSREIIETLSKEANNSKIEELKSLFQTADLVKFAKHSALINENDRNLISALDFINSTKQEDLPQEEKIEPKLTSEDKRSMRSRLVLRIALVVLPIICVGLLVFIVYRLYTLLVI